jgi:hypothetical protein
VSLPPDVEQMLLYGVAFVTVLGGLVVAIWQFMRFRNRDRDED